MIHICPHCGAILKDGNVESCQWCGKKLTQKKKSNNTKFVKIGVVVFVTVAVIAASIAMMVLV